MFSEKGIWPALVVAVRYPEAGTLLSLAQDRPQTPTNKAINLAEDREPCMFEVAKPSFQNWIEFGNDILQAAAARATRLLTNLVPQGLETLGTHVALTARKPVTVCFRHPGLTSAI